VTELLVPAIVILGVGLFLTRRRMSGWSAPWIFGYMQLIMAVGILPDLNWNIEADRVHGALILGTFVTYVVSTVGLSLVPTPRQTNRSANTHRFAWTRPRVGITALTVLSICICVWYYSSIGYLALFEGLQNASSGAGQDIAGLRLASYAGDSALYPGYVNQFKNTLLPALTVIIVGYLYSHKAPQRHLTAILLAGASVIFLLGTGQRGAFVTFAIALVLFVRFSNPSEFRRRFVVLFACSLPIFLVSTFALGRSSAQLSTAESGAGRIVVLLQEVIYRIFGSNQEAAIAGFRYIYELPNQQGADWLLSFKGLLPGVSGSTLDNQIFAYLYASDRGNAPPSIWGSAFYNFGYVGALVVAALMAGLLVFLARRYKPEEPTNSLTLIGYVGMVTVLATWVAGTPVTFLNGGLVVYLGLYLVGKRLQARDGEDAVLPRRHAFRNRTTAHPPAFASSRNGKRL
jgi:oligosaccharide repeat unit polymerase